MPIGPRVTLPDAGARQAAPPGLERWPIDVAGLGHIDVFALRFSAAGHDRRDFERYGIDCPERIAASVAKRQAEYLHGRLVAAAALRHLGCGEYRVASGMQREPVWPEGTTGSITHTAGLAAAVALPSSAGVSIGIDLEPLAGADALEALTQQVVSPAERGRLDARAPAAALTAVFSAKESFYKAAFAEVGRFFDFDALEFDGTEAATGMLAFTLRHELSPRLKTGRRVRIHQAWVDATTVLTLCVLPAAH